jgi:hypothetical protein
MVDDPKAFKLRNIAVAGRELALAWGDGHESYLGFDELRKAAPAPSAGGTTGSGPAPPTRSGS